MRIIATMLIASMTLTACSKRSEDVMAMYQSPSRYQNLSCEELSAEIERVSASVAQVSGQQDKVRRRDQIATGVGVVIFWPALFLLATGDEKQELARLKGEFQALETVYAQKRCAAAPSAVAAMDTSASAYAAEPASGFTAERYTPLPAGTPAPYEGVRMSSFSASDMRWFCNQPWERRISPEGRTEYNPCRVEDVFTR